MEIVLIRHGESEANQMAAADPGFFCGRWDCGLTEEGRRQAKALQGSPLLQGADAVFCSPLLRTRQTAALACSGEPIIDERLIERTHGDFDGKWASELCREERYARFFTDPTYENLRARFDICPPNGESYADVERRTAEFCNDLLQKDYRKVIIISHLAAIRCLVKAFCGLSEEETLALKVVQCSPLVLNVNRE